MRKVIGIGETILDILFVNQTAVASVPGGSTFNSMISLGRLGIPTCFVSEIGDDEVGHVVRAFLKENGVNDRYLTEYAEVKSPISLAFLDNENNASYSFYKSPFPIHPNWERPQIARDDIVVFGSYYALDPKQRYKVEELLEEARRVGAIIYYDVNFRRNHWGEAIKLMGTLIENLEYADIVRGSEEDFELLYNLQEGSRVYKEKIKFYCPRLIYSRGAKGVELYADTLEKSFPATPLKPVSTIGAGDSLNAGIIFGLIKYRVRRDDLVCLKERDWDDIIHCGLEFSAEACMHTENYISHEFAKKQQ